MALCEEVLVFWEERELHGKSTGSGKRRRAYSTMPRRRIGEWNLSTSDTSAAPTAAATVAAVA